MLADVTDTTAAYSLQRLGELSSRLQDAERLIADHPLSIYVTGSYARLEAWRESDIDVFFLHERSADESPFPYVSFIELSAQLIAATRAMNFPEFTDDGRYLEVHYVGQMERVLGSPEDDSLNAFTARMLLLLESRPLLGESIYHSLLERIIGFYFRDYADNADSFIPIFLQNDILRFWRTLTLNYEHHRLKLLPLIGDELVAKKAASALKNYKLKISRQATCFSMVAHLSSASVPVTPSTVLGLCLQTPSQRLACLRDFSSRAKELIAELDELYSAFLALVQQPNDACLEQFKDPEQRRAALQDANRYGDIINRLLLAITPPDRVRFLVI
jgi:predicted nucleotidyltransferase